MRCSFAHLANALLHLELSQQQPLEETNEKYSVPEVEIKKFSNKIREFKSLEHESPFKSRISEDLFLRMVSFFDSQSLVFVAAISKRFRTSIHGSTELFKSFQMIGKAKNIADGIKFFGQRCGNSIRSIDIGVKNKVSSSDLLTAILPSCSNLEEFRVAHQRDLCSFILQIASECPLLKVLHSTRQPGFSYGTIYETAWIPSSWKVENLQELIWNGEGKSLGCDAVLLNSLQRATKVKIWEGVRSSWVVELLSSASSTLVDVYIDSMYNEEVDSILVSIQLPSLVSLHLPHAPRSSSTQDSSLFFKSLHAPNLHLLSIEAFKPEYLSYLPLESHPAHFAGSRLLDFEEYLMIEARLRTNRIEAYQMEASSFVKATKDWNKLCTLELKLNGHTFAPFYEHLINLLTSLSPQNVESGYGQQTLLPNLQSLIFGHDHPPSYNDRSLSSKSIASLVGSRLALRRGLSSDQVAAVAAGDLSQVDQQPAGPPFAPQGTISCIKSVHIDVLLEVDDETLSWLQRNLLSLRTSHKLLL